MITDTIDMLVGRNTFVGDGLVNVDLGIYKAFAMGRGKSLDLRVQVFNLMNYVQCGFPTTDISNASFGRILGTSAGYLPRTVQISTRFRF